MTSTGQDDQAAATARRIRDLAATIAQTEDYVAAVHDDIANGPSTAAGEAPRIAAKARRFAEHERDVAGPDVADPDVTAD